MRRREDIVQAIAATIEPYDCGEARRQKFPRAAIGALAQAGALGLTTARQFGGGEQSLAEAAWVVERIATVCASTATVLQAHYAAVAVLELHGSRWLRTQVAAGEHLATLALAEAGRGADPLACRVPPRLHGGVVDLHGCKAWVPAAGEADSYLWSSQALPGHSSLTLWSVPADAPGLLVPATPGLFAPAGWDPAGLPGAAAAPVTADPVRIPAESVLGNDVDGGVLAHGLVARWFVVLGAAVSLGLMHGALADAVTAVRAAGRGSRSWAAGEVAIGDMRSHIGFVRGLLDAVLDPAGSAGDGGETALLVLRAAAADGAVSVCALARELWQRQSAGTGAADQRYHDARSAAALNPVPQLTTASHLRATRQAPAPVLRPAPPAPLSAEPRLYA